MEVFSVMCLSFIKSVLCREVISILYVYPLFRMSFVGR